MKIAVVYNREQQNVINLFGLPNQEKIGKGTIQRIADALKKGKHQVRVVEGDKDLVRNLEAFMPRVVSGERPGLVFNLSYGIQGQARYTHVPSILEMVGIPYVGSGPLAHSLALDKSVSKMIFRENGLPTPDFHLMEDHLAPLPDLPWPMIVKPRNEAVSFGLKVVHDEAELREAAEVIFDKFRQAVLLEQYIDGREVNVGLLGNGPPETFEPVLLDFGDGPAVYRYEDKMGKSGREVIPVCPATIGDELTLKAKDLAVKAFQSLGCFDCARVDMRLDSQDRFHILEINSLPSLGPRGSYVAAAKQAGLDYPSLVNRLVEVASARYFGTPSPPVIHEGKVAPSSQVFSFLTERRDRLEKRVHAWTRRSSRTHDLVGIQESVRDVSRIMDEIKMRPVADLTEVPFVRTWETARGLDGGTLLVAHLDVPLERQAPPQAFRLEPEWIYGEGVGVSRAPLVMLEYALRSLRHQRRLRRLPLGVLYYTDEGNDCRFSADIIERAASRAKRVLVLRPGSVGNQIVTKRRGQRVYRLLVKGQPRRPGHTYRKPEVTLWVGERLERLAGLTSRKDRLSVSPLNIETRSFPMLLPHEVEVTLIVSYGSRAQADRTEAEIRELLGRKGWRWTLETVSDRPSMTEGRTNRSLARFLKATAEKWDIPIETQASVWPSAGGLVPARTPVVCGVGPVARDLYTPQEAVSRISLVQRTLLLAQFLLETD
ncbi:MAG: D-alanine--D-alanine ligase [Deltaproteobacteria bacterium]|nr:D-alanine--D-alanine ligase [Deltaproteobacteria bacterium]